MICLPITRTVTSWWSAGACSHLLRRHIRLQRLTMPVTVPADHRASCSGRTVITSWFRYDYFVSSQSSITTWRSWGLEQLDKKRINRDMQVIVGSRGVLTYDDITPIVHCAMTIMIYSNIHREYFRDQFPAPVFLSWYPHIFPNFYSHSHFYIEENLIQFSPLFKKAFEAYHTSF